MPQNQSHLGTIRHKKQANICHSFSLDPEGRFIFASGSASGRLASYRINGDTGELTPLETYSLGQRPGGVLVTSLVGYPLSRCRKADCQYREVRTTAL